MKAVKLCGIMANDNERTADGADNGNGNNDSTQKVDEMLPNEINRDDMPEQPGHDEAQTFPPIVNALLTYVVSIMKNATNPRLLELSANIIPVMRSKMRNQYCVTLVM